MIRNNDGLEADIAAIARIPFLPQLLDVVCTATGMGFAAVARVTEHRWIAGAVKDEIQFGLVPGGELLVESTICHEIRQSENPVIIDHVSSDKIYSQHHTPATYGFESYISFPLIRKDGTFFGTLCAIDPRAAQLNTPPIVNLFTILATLIIQYLDGMETLSASNIAKLEMYTTAELRNFRQDISDDEHSPSNEGSPKKIDQLSLKLDQLLMALEPDGVFLT
jgi:GAF domain-containing protein